MSQIRFQVDYSTYIKNNFFILFENLSAIKSYLLFQFSKQKCSLEFDGTRQKIPRQIAQKALKTFDLRRHCMTWGFSRGFLICR